MARRRGKRQSPEDVNGVLVTLEYKDTNGERTTRPVRVLRYYDDRKPTLYAHCGLRGAARSFLVERIESVIDADGVVETPYEFLARFGIFPEVASEPVVPPPLPPPLPRGSEPAAPSPAVVAAVVAHNASVATPIDTPPPTPTPTNGEVAAGCLVIVTPILAVAFLVTGGANAMFGFLSLASLLLVLIAAVWPKIMYPNTEKPSRLKAAGIAFAIFLLIVVVGMLITG